MAIRHKLKVIAHHVYPAHPGAFAAATALYNGRFQEFFGRVHKSADFQRVVQEYAQRDTVVRHRFRVFAGMQDRIVRKTVVQAQSGIGKGLRSNSQVVLGSRGHAFALALIIAESAGKHQHVL